MFSCHRKTKNILVGLTRNNRGNDQGTRRKFLCPLCANILSLFLGIFCLISYLFLPVTKSLLGAISLHFVKMRDHCSQYGIQPSPQGFSLKKKMGGLVWNLDLKDRWVATLQPQRIIS